MHLGVTREGGDLEGKVLQERAVECDRAAVHVAVERFVGDIDQLPPMYSALKHEGRPLYELARAGQEIEREPRRVSVFGIDVIRFDSPTLVLDVRCSKGTYIRTLAEDIGQALGCGAHLSGLRRLSAGAFDVNAAITLDDAERLDEAGRDARLLPPDTLLAHWPRIDLGADDAARFLTGLRRRVHHTDTAHLRVYGPHPTHPNDTTATAATAATADRCYRCYRCWRRLPWRGACARR